MEDSWEAGFRSNLSITRVENHPFSVDIGAPVIFCSPKKSTQKDQKKSFLNDLK